VLPDTVLPDTVLPDTVLPDTVLPGPEMIPDASDEPGEAFPLLCAGELPLLGDEPAGDVEMVAGAVGLLAAEVTGVGFGVADVLACAVGLPQMVPAFCLAGFFLVPLGLAVAGAVA
jgi:hypothetical protein